MKSPPPPPCPPEATPIPRPLGTMIAYGFPRPDVEIDLALALRMGATFLEVLPDWPRHPDPRPLRARAADLGLRVHSIHGCWGGRAIQADRVDLAATDDRQRRASIEDLARCCDWLDAVGGRVLVVHPGGLSDPNAFDARRGALAESLLHLADHVAGSDLLVCVENLPPGVHPGSRMADLTALLADLDRPELGLALDTGHAHIAATPASETLAAGPYLRTTHVHDNNGRLDTHEPPGLGTLDWAAWLASLDQVAYRGPILLECIRRIRHAPECLDDAFFALLDRLTHGGRNGSMENA